MLSFDPITCCCPNVSLLCRFLVDRRGSAPCCCKKAAAAAAVVLVGIFLLVIPWLAMFPMNSRGVLANNLCCKLHSSLAPSFWLAYKFYTPFLAWLLNKKLEVLIRGACWLLGVTPFEFRCCWSLEWKLSVPIFWGLNCCLNVADVVPASACFLDELYLLPMRFWMDSCAFSVLDFLGSPPST